jgi:HSP20 family protein
LQGFSDVHDVIAAAHGAHRNSEDTMIERAQIVGWLPSGYEPPRSGKEAVADWIAPRSEACVSPEAYQVNVELPGVAVEDIDISMRDGMMTIKGEKRFENEEDGDSYFFSEREYGAFQRSFRLPGDAAPEGITADFRNGC